MNLGIEPMQILSLDIGEAYELYNILKIEIDENKDETKQIEFGIKTKFYIINYLEGNYVKKPKQQKIKIENKIIDYTDFHKEIHERSALLKSILFKWTEETDSIQAR
jgi:hypothetical protein